MKSNLKLDVEVESDVEDSMVLSKLQITLAASKPG